MRFLVEGLKFPQSLKVWKENAPKFLSKTIRSTRIMACWYMKKAFLVGWIMSLLA